MANGKITGSHIFNVGENKQHIFFGLFQQDGKFNFKCDMVFNHFCYMKKSSIIKLFKEKIPNRKLLT